jgi:hypothetical protein
MLEANEEPSWMTVSKKKRGLQQAAIAPFRSMEYPVNTTVITDIEHTSELAGLIARGHFKALDVSLAYIGR